MFMNEKMEKSKIFVLFYGTTKQIKIVRKVQCRSHNKRVNTFNTNY